MSYDEEIYNLKMYGVKDGFIHIEIDKKLEKIATLVLFNHLVVDYDENSRKSFNDYLSGQVHN